MALAGAERRIGEPFGRSHISLAAAALVEEDLNVRADPLKGSNEIRGPFTGPRADLGRRARATDTIIILAAVMAGLSYGREVLVPISLAVLLSFVLSPLAAALARLHLGKVASVLIAVIVGIGVLVGLGTIIGKQVAQLSDNLPQYQLVISKK